MKLATNNLTIATTKVQGALQDTKRSAVEEGVDLDTAKTTTTVNLVGCSKEFLRALITQDPTSKQRAILQAALGDKAAILGEMISGPVQLGKLLQQLVDQNDPNVEIQIGSRWYPVPVHGVDARTDTRFGSYCHLQIAVKVVDRNIQKMASWDDGDFLDENKQPKPMTVKAALEQEGIRLATPESKEAIFSRISKSNKFVGLVGKTMSATGSVLVPNKFLYRGGLDSVALGSVDKPRQLIIEDQLELDGNQGCGYGNDMSFRLPFVRAFSLDLKKYVYADIDDLSVYNFDKTATSKLVLPAKMSGILNKIFDASTSEIFGDLFKGRHGGMVVLANGPQGVGKTLTAECFAEVTERPLYVLEMGELGTNLSSVEESLQRVFTRATRWNAVLLFDEADVFLAKREEHDLERSAIVGVFLRLLDRYEGMFFLTTNRAGVIDTAFRSRITLKLDYPELDRDARKRVWDSMFESAGLHVEGDLTPIYETKIDGRQIRNQVRLLRVMHKGEQIHAEDVVESLSYVVTD